MPFQDSSIVEAKELLGGAKPLSIIYFFCKRGGRESSLIEPLFLPEGGLPWNFSGYPAGSTLRVSRVREKSFGLFGVTKRGSEP